MVTDLQIALRALHEALVAARNLGLENRDPAAVLDIVDTLERVPLWIADPVTDRSEDLVRLFGELATAHEGCRLAAATAATLRAS